MLWPGIVDNLPPNQRVWLASSKPLMLAENTAVVAVPNEFTRNQLEGRLRTRIEDTLSERLGKPVRLAVSVDPTLELDRASDERPLAGRRPAAPTRRSPTHRTGPAIRLRHWQPRLRRDPPTERLARRRNTAGTHRHIVMAICRQSHPAPR